MGSRASLNPLQSIANGKLQTTANNAIEFDTRNDGIVVSTYFRHSLDKSVIVFDLRSVSGDNSPIDVFRVFLDFAEQLRDKPYDFVELAYNSDTKFRIEGSYFQHLGRERRYQNPAYTIRTFSENLQTPAGLPAYSQWTGGMLGVLTRQMEDFNDFHEKWYLDDMVRRVLDGVKLTRSLAPGDPPYIRQVSRYETMQIHIASRRCKLTTIEKRYPGAAIYYVTSKGKEPWVRFSPFYPHGDIPVP